MQSLTTNDGLRLHLQRWSAPGPAHGTVQIVHGLGEHIGRYAALAAMLNAAGWHVAGHDHRGHGRSEGARGTIAGQQSLLADLGAVSDHVREGGRLVLLGHSLGGLIAARFVAEGLRTPAARWFRDVDGLVLSSPALDAGLSAVQKLQLALGSLLAPNLRLANGLKPEWVSRDPDVVRRYEQDPLVHDRVTARLVRFVVDAGQLVRSRAPRWQVPTLLLWAGADRCVAPAGSAAFAAAAPAGVVTAQAFPKLYHEIFNEPEREQVLGHLSRWLARFESPPENLE
ncbi:MAG TPA: lysophospholipase [Rubrivivax sp.]|nr:lysophospholipase [Rubrivivax sp.]